MTFFELIHLVLNKVVEGHTFLFIQRLQRGMCRYFCETPQAFPCGLCDDIHVIEARSRICTEYFASPI